MVFINRTTVRIAVAASAVMLLLVSCSDYNPFSNPSNARAHASLSFSEFDTIPIFSTESLTVIVTVGELVDSVVLQAPDNRFWRDTTLHPPFQAKSFDFTVSLFDTGETYVSIFTYVENHDPVEKKYNLYAVSPIKQKSTIQGFYEDTFELATDSVLDKDVSYVWDFGGGIVLRSFKPETTVVLQKQSLDSIGALYVRALHDTFESPPMPFRYRIVDNRAPKIILLNRDADGNEVIIETDTLISGDTIFPLKALISDGSGAIEKALINGESFDRSNGQEYTKRLVISADTSPKKYTITASDKQLLQQSKTFWLVYDPDAKKRFSTLLQVYIPGNHTLTTGKREYRIIGDVEDYNHDSLIVTCNIGDKKKRISLTDGVGEWTFDVHLSNGENDVRIQAQTLSGDSLSQARFELNYDQDLIDTIAPYIWRIRLDGNMYDGKHYYTSSDKVDIEVIAFDDGSRIDSLVIDGSAASSGKSEENDTAFTWSHSIHGLIHGTTPVVVKAMDNAGNDVDTTILIVKNEKPVFDAEQTGLPEILHVDTLYFGQIVYYENDGDRVTVEARGKSRGAIDSSGYLEWKPSSNDVGENVDTIILDDGYQKQLHIWHYQVVDLSKKANKVEFLTSTKDFPKFIIASVESVWVPLRIAESTGKPPFTYSATSSNRNEDFIFRDSIVSWKPAISDTGSVFLQVTVTDDYGEMDSFFPELAVIPPNRPCSLSARYSGEVDGNGFWKLTEAGPQETLFVQIHDEDINRVPNNEKFTIISKRNGVENRLSADSRGMITLLVSPMSIAVGIDTLDISVSDSKGHTDSLQYVLNFGHVPGVPYNLSPGDSLFTDSIVALSWECDDPDKDNLSYDVYLGTFGQLNRIAENLSTTRYEAIVRTTAKHYWKVVATDGKNSTESTLRHFSYENQNRVRFITKREDFLPLALYSGKVNTLPLSVEGGQPPYSFSGGVDGSTSSPYFSGDKPSMIWNPAEADTGLKRATIIVSDANNNKDTLNPLMYIALEGSQPGAKFLLDGGDEYDTIFIDTQHPTETVEFTIEDGKFNYSTNYTVTVVKSGVSISRVIPNKQTFKLTFVKGPDVFGYEHVTIMVAYEGQSIEKHIVIDYGL